MLTILADALLLATGMRPGFRREEPSLKRPDAPKRLEDERRR